MVLETVKEVFETMPKVFAADQASGVDAVFQFHITGEQAGDWLVIVKSSSCQVNDRLTFGN